MSESYKQIMKRKIAEAKPPKALQRTPTPFKVDKGITHNKFLILDKKGEGIAAMYEGPNAEMDAAFIVKAVNAHEELVAALKEVLARATNGNFAWGPVNQIHKALARAEGK